MFELTLFVLVFILLSGLMAAIEAAILNVTPAEVEELNLEKAWGATALKEITASITQPLVVIVIFTNTINVLGPILAGRQAIQLYGDVAIGMITAVLTVGTIIFSEIIPKSLGSHYAPLISRVAAPIIRLWIVLLYPFVILLERISGLLKKGERPIGTEMQIRSLTKIGRREGLIANGEGQLVRRAFLLNDRSAASIMTPRSEVVAMPSTTTIGEASRQVFHHAYSRYPVIGKSIDQIEGLIMSRDILEALSQGKADDPISTISQTILQVPADMRSDELLVRFRNAHIHLAVVRDQQQTLGVVTLEDVLEELVGEIEDEKDV